MLFFYLLCSVMIRNISEWIMIIKIAKIWANSGLNYPFTSKEDFFGKATSITNITTHYPTTFRTNP